MPVQPGAFDPEVVATLSEIFESACRELPAVAREIIADRIVWAAKLGERDPVRLRKAALGKRA
jgi:hypothetical protein